MRSDATHVLRRLEQMVDEVSEYVRRETTMLRVSMSKEIAEVSLTRKRGSGRDVIGVNIGDAECQVSLFGIGPFDFVVQAEYRTHDEDPVELVRAALLGGAVEITKGRSRYLVVGGSTDIAEEGPTGRRRAKTTASFAAWVPDADAKTYEAYILRRP